MADDIRSWIGKSLINHNETHGSNLGVVRRGELCQLTQFDTYRSTRQPHVQITGRISDKTHWIKVLFDVKATDDFEASKHGLPSESLTSHLRSIFRIKAYRIHLSHRPYRPDRSRSSSHLSRADSERSIDLTQAHQPDIPLVKLEILKWEVVVGNRDDPVFYERTEEVGMGKGDGEVQRVLRKWWAGESQDAEAEQEQVAGPSSVRPVISVKPKSSDLKGNKQISSSQLFDHIMQYPNVDRVKALPDWVFEVSPDQQEELDGIGMFGLDPEKEMAAIQALPPDEIQSVAFSNEPPVREVAGRPPESVPVRDETECREPSKPTPTPQPRTNRAALPTPASSRSAQTEEPIDVFIPPRQTPPTPDPVHPQATMALPQLAQRTPPSRPSGQARSSPDQRKEGGRVELDRDGSEATEEGDGGAEEDESDSSEEMEMSIRPLTGGVARKARKSFEVFFDSLTSNVTEGQRLQDGDQGQGNGKPQQPGEEEEDEDVEMDEDVDEADLSDYEIQQRRKKRAASLNNPSKDVPTDPTPPSPVTLSLPNDNQPPQSSTHSSSRSDKRRSLDHTGDTTRSTNTGSQTQSQTQTGQISSVEEAQRPVPGQTILPSPWPNNRTRSERLRTPSESLSESPHSGGVSLSRYTTHIAGHVAARQKRGEEGGRRGEEDEEDGEDEEDMEVDMEEDEGHDDRSREVVAVLVDDSEESLQKTAEQMPVISTTPQSTAQQRVLGAKHSMTGTSDHFTSKRKLKSPPPSGAAASGIVNSAKRAKLEPRSPAPHIHLSSPVYDATSSQMGRSSTPSTVDRRSALSYFNSLNLLRGGTRTPAKDNGDEAETTRGRNSTSGSPTKREERLAEGFQQDTVDLLDRSREHGLAAGEPNAGSSRPAGSSHRSHKTTDGFDDGSSVRRKSSIKSEYRETLVQDTTSRTAGRSSSTRVISRQIKRSRSPSYRPSILAPDLCIDHHSSMSRSSLPGRGRLSDVKVEPKTESSVDSRKFKRELLDIDDRRIDIPKLRGFKPDLRIRGGLSESWIKARKAEAESMRAARNHRK